MADGLVDRASSGELFVELGFADPSEPEAISKEVLGLIVGGDYDLEAVVFHGALRLVDAQRIRIAYPFTRFILRIAHFIFRGRISP